MNTRLLATTILATAVGVAVLSGCGGPAGPANVWDRTGPYPVHRAAGPITIDNRPHPEQWSAATVIRDWIQPVSGAPADERTEMRMLWDDRCLYVRFVAADGDLVGTFKRRDDPIYEEDVVELFIEPYADKPFYYEFEVNPIGTVMALQIPGAKEKAGKSLADMSQWETGIRSAVIARGTVNAPSDRDKGYEVVMAIPWEKMKLLSGPPRPGQTSRFIGARCNSGKGLSPKGRQYSAVVRLTKLDFHPNPDYPSLTFVE